MQYDSPAQAVSARLGEVAKLLDDASELASLLGDEGLASDLAVAMVTAQRARSTFNRDTDRTSAAVTLRSLPIGELEA